MSSSAAATPDSTEFIRRESTSDPSLNPSDRLELRELGKCLDSILRESENEDEATARFTALVRKLIQGSAVLYYGLNSDGLLSAEPCNQDPDELNEATRNQLFVLARRTQDGRIAQLAQPEAHDDHVALSIPVFRRDGGVEILIGLKETNTENRQILAGVMQQLQLLAAFASQWRGNFDALRASTDRKMFASLAAASTEANTATRLRVAAEAYAQVLWSLTGAELATISIRAHGGTCRLLGASNQFPFVRGAPLVRALEAASAERMASPSNDVKSVDTVEDRETDAVRQIRDAMQAKAVYRVALSDGTNGAVGACVVVCNRTLTATERSQLHTACDVIGPHLARLKRAKPSWLVRARTAFDQWSESARRAAVTAAVASIVLLFVLPFPYRVHCPCEIQPVNRRFIAAPYEGRLQDARVQPGDLVKAGQVLAVMDGREVRLELAGLAAEVQRVTKQRDRALANRETAAAQIALLEMQRLQSNIQLLEDRLDNLEIRCPTEGVVISGDPKKLKGARLTIGQTLLEVGPLGDMVLEVAIADKQIGHVRANSPVAYRLDALPQSTSHGHLTRVHPRSELRDTQNVFIGEVTLSDPNEQLRPGMRGRAKIFTGRRSLFWIVFHRAIDEVFFRMGW